MVLVGLLEEILNTSRFGLSGCGTQNAGLSFGGNSGVTSNITEEYNGSAWSSGGNLNTARYYLGGCGTLNSGLSFGGITTTNITEEYNGSAWSSGGNLNQSKGYLGGSGIQNSGLCLGNIGSNVEKYNGYAWYNTGNLNTDRKHPLVLELKTILLYLLEDYLSQTMYLHLRNLMVLIGITLPMLQHPESFYLVVELKMLD